MFEEEDEREIERLTAENERLRAQIRAMQETESGEKARLRAELAKARKEIAARTAEEDH